MTRSAASAQNSGEIYCQAMALDSVNNFVYCGTGQNPGRVVKHNTATMSRVAAVSGNSGETQIRFRSFSF